MGVQPSAAAGEYYQQPGCCLLACFYYYYYRRCTIFLGQHVIYLISPCIVCKFNQLPILFWQHSSLFMDPHKYCVLLSKKQTHTHKKCKSYKLRSVCQCMRDHFVLRQLFGFQIPSDDFCDAQEVRRQSSTVFTTEYLLVLYRIQAVRNGHHPRS